MKYFPSGSRSCEEGRIAVFHCARLRNVLDFRFFMVRHFVDLENLFFFFFFEKRRVVFSDAEMTVTPFQDASKGVDSYMNWGKLI